MNEGLIKIILAVIGLLSAIVTGVAVPYIKSKTTENQRMNIFTVVTFAVSAADQLLKQSDPTGKKRKDYVINYLRNKGIKLTVEDLEVFIEAAVKELNMVEKQFLPPEDALE